MKKKSNFLIASLFIFEMLFNAFISFGQPVTPLSDDGLKFNSGQIDFENKNDGYKRDEDKNYPDLDKMFKSYEILDINSAAFVNSILTGPTEVIITLPVNNGKMLDLKIQSSGIIGTEHSTLVSDEKGIQEIQGINALPMKGIVKEMPDSEVSLTFNQNFIYGFIKTDKEFVFIEPLYHFVNKAPYDQYVIYNTEDIIVDTELRCGLTEMESERTKLKKENIDIRVSLLGNYYLVRYNTASDFSMFNHYGGITQVQNHNTGVLNNMQSNYDNEFNDEIRFQMGQQFVSTCNTCDPWTNSTNADVLLTSFRNWAPNGFNQAYDCASLWTRRDLDGSTIGIAYNPGICNGTLRVNVLQDWSTNAQLKRVMLAHEVGHNFDADHDAENSSFIMTPTNNNTNTWSTTSINTVGNYCDNISCLSVARRPANVTASDGTFFDKVTIGWTGQAGNFFRVYRNTTNNSSTATALGSWQTNTFYYDLSAVPLQTYYYWVKASLNSSGTQCSILSISNTGWKNGVTIPTNVLASDGTYFDKVQITWTGTSGHYFRVYRNTSNNSSTATALGSWQTSTTYNDASANPLATFYYWVKAASDGNGSNSSAFSSSNSGWRNAVQSPTNVQASDGTYFDKVIVTWSGYGPYFRVYRNTTNNSSTATALGSWQTSPTYNDVSANPLVTYYYWIKAAENASGANSSAFSSSNSGWRNAVQPPTNVQASDGTYFDKVVVSWSGYGPYFRVYRNTTNNSSTATALGSWQTSPTYNDVSANPLVIYYYWIKAAENASGANSSAFSSSNTGWRNGVTVPINVQASNGTYNNRVYVAWSGTTGNYFRVYRNTTNNSSTATALGSWQTATSYNDYNVVLNQLYYYWVKAASNASGANSSAFSAYDTGWRGNGIVPPTITIEDDNPVESLISTVCPNPVKSNSDFEIAIDFEIEKIKDIKIVDMKGRVQNELHFRDNQTNSSIKLKAPEINGIYLYLIELHNGIRLQNKIIVY